MATFDEGCFLENVALASMAEGPTEVRRSYEALFTAFPDLSPDSEGEAFGDDVFVTWGTVHGTMEGPWIGLPPTGKSFRCPFVNVVPFRKPHPGRTSTCKRPPMVGVQSEGGRFYGLLR